MAQKQGQNFAGHYGLHGICHKPAALSILAKFWFLQWLSIYLKGVSSRDSVPCSWLKHWRVIRLLYWMYGAFNSHAGQLQVHTKWFLLFRPKITSAFIGRPRLQQIPKVGINEGESADSHVTIYWKGSSWFLCFTNMLPLFPSPFALKPSLNTNKGGGLLVDAEKSSIPFRDTFTTHFRIWTPIHSQQSCMLR